MEQQNEIAKIAYEIYLMRNGAPGDPVSDWLTAERIFAERQAKSLTLRTLAEPVMTEEPAVSITEASGNNGNGKVETPVFLATKSRKKTATKAEPAAKTSAPKKTKAAAAPARATAAPKPEPEVKPAKQRASRKKTVTE